MASPQAFDGLPDLRELRLIVIGTGNPEVAKIRTQENVRTGIFRRIAEIVG